jgi:3-deoxy-manno-octulosonate cytidylyltransferase (CMP-KDO synthetase)
MEKVVCIIPARYESSRFPGKPLANICGKSMLCRVFENAKKSKFISDVIIATDDDRIYKHCNERNINVVYTSKDCENGSVRVAEVAKKYNDDYIFEMQGDQPLVTSDIIDKFLIRSLDIVYNNPDIDVVIPYAEATEEQTNSPDVLKVVVTKKEKLVFQSRFPIKTGFRTLGLYLWNRNSLLKFASLPESEIEKEESSHPIRLYVNDFNVQGLLIDGSDWVEVDRKEHIKQVEDLLKNK